MATETHVVQTGSVWYVETPSGRIGPMGTQKEAQDYLTLMQIAYAAGSETACTEAECLL